MNQKFPPIIRFIYINPYTHLCSVKNVNTPAYTIRRKNKRIREFIDLVKENAERREREPKRQMIIPFTGDPIQYLQQIINNQKLPDDVKIEDFVDDQELIIQGNKEPKHMLPPITNLINDFDNFPQINDDIH